MRTAFCFDLDNTITRQEILPALAYDLGLFEEMAALTRLTMDGAVPFETSFRLRCEVLKQIPLTRARSIISDVPLETAIVEFINARQQSCFVLTGNLDVWIVPLVDRLGCRFFSSTGKHEGAALKGLDSILNKADAVGVVREMGFSRVVAIGDGMNDVSMLQAADIGIAYGGVRPPATGVIEAADYVIFSDEALCRLLNTL